MSASDHELIGSCLRGEQEGWTELIAKYQRLIYSVARTLCPQPEDCADVFQHVCVDLYQNLSSLRNEATLPAWLITVTRRRSYSVLRSRKALVPIEDYDAPAASAVEAIEKEFALRAAVDQLPGRCRQLVQLLYFDAAEPSYAEIASRLEMPVPSVGPTRARCLEKLKNLLQP